MKTKLMYFAVLLFAFCFYSPLFAGSPITTNPAQNREIFIYLDSGPDLIANVTTNNEGEFTFSFPERMTVPKKGVLKMCIGNSQNRKSKMNDPLVSVNEFQIVFQPFKASDGPNFTFVLTWKYDKAQSKGAFAVSGKSDA
jgi:hypothetical protein